MSSRQPFWYCHQCHAEMRPLMAPDPHCASCRGTFVEEIQAEDDHPRDFRHSGPDVDLGYDSMPPGMDAFIAGIRNLMTQPPAERQRRNNAPTSGASPSPSGVRIEMRGNGGTRTFTIGGSNTLGRDSPARPPVDRAPSLMDFLSQEPENDNARISGPLMAQYLSAMMGSRNGSIGALAELFGTPPSGDYVNSEADFNQILSQIMESTNSHKPVPATQEIVDKLPREVLEEECSLLQKDCAVCKDQFSLKVDDPDELVVITLPCKHPFHQGCILPWLKSSGTCPVCRFALIKQPDSDNPQSGGARPTGTGSSSSSSSSSSPSPRSPNPDMYNSFFSSFMGAGNSSGSSSHGRTNSDPGRGAPNRRRSGSPDVPGAWADQVD